jgi:hypothetical protein
VNKSPKKSGKKRVPDRENLGSFPDDSKLDTPEELHRERWMI